MGDKVKAILAGITVIAAVLLGTTLPARAAVVLHGCDERLSTGGWGSLCLFDGTEFGKGSWRQHDLRAIAARPGGCLTLAAGFRNVTSSFAHNPSFVGQAELEGDRLRFWAGSYCTGRATSWDAATERADNDLRTTANYGNISNWTESVSVS